ncbi:MAG: TonB-dependent receptor [Muribaculaceae bacterium]|nr:TonB-dependent receptor [Muribaculaceae bacterium]
MLVLLPLILAITFPSFLFAQKGASVVTGIVVDESSSPLLGVTVMVQGTSVGTSTDFEGNFSVNVPSGASKIEFSYIGYEKQIVTIPSTRRIKVTMNPDTKVIDEVVVIGYGTQKKDDLTGSVSSIGEKDFNQGLISSPEQLVNGKVAGVQIVNSGGSPTAGSTIRIRGGASLNASNEPLVVLDGVPMEVGGSVTGSGNFLSLINPNDIESMTILKDASSTAIYGSRASNGVIIITTKKGSGSDKIKVSFSTTNSFQTKTKTADMLSRQEFIDLVNAQGTDNQKSLIGESNTDWNDQIYKTAFGTDNNLSVAGRFTKDFPFRVSFGYYNQDGILKTDNATRYTGTVSLSPSFFDNHLKFVFNGKGTMSKNTFANTDAIWGGATLNPTVPVYTANSTFHGGFNEAADANGEPITGAVGNPLGTLMNYNSTSDVYRMIANADVDYTMHFLPELRLHGTVGYDYSKGSGDVYVPADAYQYYTSGGRNYHYGPQKNYNKLLTIYLNYNKEFKDIKTTVDVTAGYDYQYWKYTWDQYTETNVAGEVKSTSSPVDQRHVLLSYYGRANVTFDSKYLLTATMRRDGSSRFSETNRWGTFPSIALAWRLSKESFYEPISGIMNDFKIRLSYGVTGQQDGIANYSYIPVYTISQAGAQYMFNGTPINTYRPQAYNSDLKWETTEAYNAGFDFGFLSNRITGSFDYYNRKTKDLLSTVPIAAGTNFDKQMLTNVGNVSSSGVELSISATPIQTKDLTWTVSANATWQKNRITNLKLTESTPATDTPAGAIESHYVQVLSEGYAPYSYYVYKQIYDEATGKPIEGLYADLSGDGKIDSDDLYHYHSPAPDWILGFSTSLQYKKWTLSTSLRANIGNYLYNGMAMNTGAWNTMSYNDYQLNNLNKSYLSTGFKSRQYETDYYVENASFLKMDNIQLGYNFGRITKWLGLNASVMVQNVFTITKYKGVDPESQSGIDMSVYPRPRIYSLTLGLDF